MKRTFIFSLILFLLFTLNQTSRASHIVGGDISYECLGPSPTTGIMQYRITMHVYRDRINGRAPFDNPAYVGIYAGLNTSSVDTVLALGNPDTTDIPIVFSNPCLIVPPTWE